MLNEHALHVHGWVEFWSESSQLARLLLSD